MNFGVAKAVQNLKTKVYSSYPNYTNEPIQDFNNPGVSLKMYRDVVPLNAGYFHSEIKPKVDAEKLVTVKKAEEDVIEQEGSGTDKLIENSFMHPQPIKTEMFELFVNKGAKRKSEKNKSSEPTKKSKINHKFQFF